MYYDLISTSDPLEHLIYFCAGEDEDWDPVAKIIKKHTGWYEVQTLNGQILGVQKFLFGAFKYYLNSDTDEEMHFKVIMLSDIIATAVCK